jgi:hypothetical protein
MLNDIPFPLPKEKRKKKKGKKWPMHKSF